MTKWLPFCRQYFSNAFSWLKIFSYWLKFQCLFFIGTGNGLAQNREQIIVWKWLPVLHIDTTDITEIGICPLILISILWYHSHQYISVSHFSGFAQNILQKNTANTLWLARMIIPILNVRLSILNPMVIFTCSSHFPTFWESSHLLDESSLKLAQI